MITFEELDKLAQKAFEDDEVLLKEWNDKKECLIPHPEPYPCNWHTLEDGTEDCDWEYEMVASFGTYDEEIAYFCWGNGCALHTSYDWVDGSPRFSVIWPADEKEYQENLAEYRKWHKEVYEEE